jgi:imidazolonepropionase-like amidohydrolase
MIVKQDAALKISLEPSAGESRMGRLSKLRQILDETKRWMEERKKKPHAGKADGKAGKDDDASREALVALLDGTMPAIIHCATAADVSAAFGLAREYGFRFNPVIGTAAWRAAPLLKVNGVTAVLTPQMEAWERRPDGTVLRVELPRILHDAGVPFTLSTDPYDAGAQHPWYQAALAVRAGVPRDVALASITKTPARLLGFGARKGVIETGADADFLLLSGDPLSGAAFVEESYIRGTRIYSRDTDEKMKRLLSRTSEPPMAATTGDVEDENRVDEETAPPGAKSVSKDPAERVRRWPFAWGPR